MGSVNRIGDLYHKHLYRHLTHATSKITDATDLCITDIGLVPALFIHEIVVGGIGYIVWMYANAESSTEIYNITSTLIKTGAAILAIPTFTYFLNIAKTPLEKKLNLDVAKLDKEKEIRYTIQRLNELSNSDPLTFDEVAERTNKALDDFVAKVEGYRVKHAKKVKKSRFSRALFARGAWGLTNPLIHEVVVTCPMLTYSIANEKAHLIGYMREAEAQFMGYASMLDSSDKSLQYLAYRQRLDVLMDAKTYSRLEELGLNSRTRDELNEIYTHFGKEYDKLSIYTKAKMRIGDKIRSLFLKCSRQGNIETAYLNKPLQLISAYDPPR